jgi:hypothetical protein
LFRVLGCVACAFVHRVAHMSQTIAGVVRKALDEAGHLTPKGELTRDAERQTGLTRGTVGRALASGEIKVHQLAALAALLDVKPSELVARAEETAA